MVTRYYDNEGNMNEHAFIARLNELERMIDDASYEELLSIRRKLYALKRQHERCGRRFLECENLIEALNEIISDFRKDR